MLASDVVNIVDSHGILEIARMYQLSRRQAESFEIQARRLLAAGSSPVVVPDEVGTVRATHGAGEPLGGAQELSGGAQEGELETQAQAKARRIKAESAGLRDHSIAQLRARIRTLERNVEKGFNEWSYDLALSRRIVELVEGVTIA